MANRQTNLNKTLPVRMGVVGCGNVAQIRYLPDLAGREDVDMIGVADYSEVLARTAANVFAGRQTLAVTDSDRLLPFDLDGVVILNHDHFDLVRKFLGNGVSVYVEKPICWRAHEVEDTIGLAKRNNVTLFAAYVRRFDAMSALLRRELLQRGPPIAVHVRHYAGSALESIGRQEAILSTENRTFIEQQLGDAWEQRLRDLPPPLTRPVKPSSFY